MSVICAPLILGDPILSTPILSNLILSNSIGAGWDRAKPSPTDGVA